MEYDVERIRNTNSLFDWLDRYGVTTDKKGFANCPFHTEKTASFKVYSDGTYHCFGCGAHGDVITFVMTAQNLSFQEACELLDRDISYSEQRKIDKAKRNRQKQAGYRENATQNYWSAFDEWKENEDRIELFKPSSPENVPNGLFLLALNRRSRLEYNLSLVEAAYTKRGVVGG